jgi:xanthine dehydrogenase small subunit
LIPIGTLADKEVITVEGLANGQLHPVQAAMVETGGSQCGYCTPGFIMSLFTAYYDRNSGDRDRSNNHGINHGIDDAAVEGNLCRCTGYLAIRRAAQQVSQMQAESLTDHFTEKLKRADAEGNSFSAEPLRYEVDNYEGKQQFYRPVALSQVLELLQQHPSATLIAGATDLGLEMSHHRQTFPILISLEAVAELKQIQQTETDVTIGAAVPLSQIEATLNGVFPSLDEMLHWFAARQVRNRATIGGNIGTASPIGDLPPVLLSLDAELELVSPQGHRWLPLHQFFKGYRQTDLQPSELIRAVKIPKTLTSGALRRISQSYKVGKRGTDDISIVAAAFTIDLDAQDRIVQARLAYGGVAATPVRATAVEQLLIGQPWHLETVQQVKPALRQTFTPLTDLRGSAEYRRRLVSNLFEKFFVEMSQQFGSESYQGR